MRIVQRYRHRLAGSVLQRHEFRDFGRRGRKNKLVFDALLDGDITNEALATASVPGGPPVGMETVTSEIDSASVSVEG